MHVMIDMSGLPPVFPGNSTWFVRNLFTGMATDHPDMQFTWWQNDSSENAGLPSNISIYSRSYPKYGWPILGWWFKKMTERKLRKSGVTLFISIDKPPLRFSAIAACVLFTRREGMPQAPEEKLSRRKASMRKLFISFHNSNAVMTLFPSHAEWLKNRFPLHAAQVRLLVPAIDGDNDVADAEQPQRTRDKFAAGTDYFLVSGFAGDDKDLFPVLKAYSLFKKWQLSHMQLLITIDPSADIESLRAVLGSYKYRHDVQLIVGITDEEWKDLLLAAYCLIHPSLHDHFPINILRSMSAGIPVISAAVPEVLDLAGDSIIYSEFTPEALGANLQLIYKDEDLRARMIGKARDVISHRNQKEMTASLSNYLLQLINGK